MTKACLLVLLLNPLPAWSEARPDHVAYVPPSRAFSCEIPAQGWSVFEEETPRGSSVHALGPVEAHGAYRAGLHVDYFDKSKPGFVPWQEALANIRKRDKQSGRESTPMTSWRVADKPARLFEILEERLLPMDRLPAEQVTLHHFYAVVPGNGEDYFLIRMSTTQSDYLDYRAEFKRFLKSFHITGYE